MLLIYVFAGYCSYQHFEARDLDSSRASQQVTLVSYGETHLRGNLINLDDKEFLRAIIKLNNLCMVSTSRPCLKTWRTAIELQPTLQSFSRTEHTSKDVYGSKVSAMYKKIICKVVGGSGDSVLQPCIDKPSAN